MTLDPSTAQQGHRTDKGGPENGIRQQKDGEVHLAALFVATNGCYFDLPGIDPWDEVRDARNYSGADPVIAHPPCERWGAMAAVNFTRWGGEHNRPGNDAGCFAFALSAVERCGGILEHPAKSKAFDFYGIGRPPRHGWVRAKDGWICEVWQSAYGHRANKATWLYYVGKRPPFQLNWTRPVGSHQIGFHDQRGKHRNKPTLSRREARATPLAFRNELIALAKWSVGGDEVSCPPWLEDSGTDGALVHGAQPQGADLHLFHNTRGDQSHTDRIAVSDFVPFHEVHNA